MSLLVMSGLRKALLALVVLGALALVAACTAGTELNPQPLPPETENTGAGGSSGGSSSGGSGSSDTPGTNADAGAVLDAADAADASDAAEPDGDQ